MSRSNTNYYNLCVGAPGFWDAVGEDGFCGLHRPHGRWQPRGKCIPPAEYMTRRGIVKRTPRHPWHSWKSHCHNPPHDMKRYWNKRLRAQARREMAARPDDPQLWPWQKALAEMYQNWT